MKKIISLIIAGVMLACSMSTVFAAARMPFYETDEHIQLHSAVQGIPYTAKLMKAADDGGKLTVEHGGMPSGLAPDVKQFDDGFFWVITGTTNAKARSYIFYLKMSYPDSTERTYTVYMDVTSYVLDEAQANRYYDRLLMVMTHDPDMDYKLSETTPLPEGLTLNMKTGDAYSFLLLNGKTLKKGSYKFDIEYKTYGDGYDFTVTYELKVGSIPYPDENDCFIYTCFDKFDGWQVRDYDGDGNTWRQKDPMWESPWHVLSLSGENGADNVLISPYFYAAGSAMSVFWVDGSKENAHYELYYTTEDTDDLSRYTLIGEYDALPHTLMENEKILHFDTTGEAADRKMHIAIRHVEDKPGAELDLFCFAVRVLGNQEVESVAVNKLNEEVNIPLLTYELKDTDTYTVKTALQKGLKVSEDREGNTLALALSGKAESPIPGTVEVRVFDKDGILQLLKMYNVTVNGYIIGDANGDGQINTGDATAILKYSAAMIQMTDDTLFFADVNRDGKVNTSDATAILRLPAGTIEP